MQISLFPGHINVSVSLSRLGEVAISKTLCAASPGLPVPPANLDLRQVASRFFLDVVSAEAHLHALFDVKWTEQDYFTTLAPEAIYELECLFESRRAERLAHQSVCRLLAEAGELSLDASGEVDETGESALATLLNHVPSAEDGRSVKALVPLALSEGTRAPLAAALLQSCGLLPYSADELVLFDKSQGSLLEIAFKNTAYAENWSAQLALFAGFNESVRSVGLMVWLDDTQAGQEVVDKVSPVFA